MGTSGDAGSYQGGHSSPDVVLYDVPVESTSFQSRGYRVLWTLLESDVPFTFKATYPRKGLVPPEFPAISPLGQVPALSCGELSLTESTAIAVFIAKKWNPQLYPFRTAEDQAQADQMLYFSTTTLEDVCLKLIFTHGKVSSEFYSTQPHSPECFQWGCRLWRSRVLPALDTFLKRKRYAMGDQFTVVDIAMAYPLIYMEQMGFLAEGFTGSLPAHGNDPDEGGAYSPDAAEMCRVVKAYLNRVRSRPAAARALSYGEIVLRASKSHQKQPM